MVNGLDKCDEYYPIRKTVFLDEQGFAYDKDDIDKISRHVIVYVNNKPVGTARFFKDGDNYHVGRVAVLKEYRNKNIGKEIMAQIVNEIKKEGHYKIILSSQMHAIPFYSKCGFIRTYKTHLDEDALHEWMYLTV